MRCFLSLNRRNSGRNCVNAPAGARPRGPAVASALEAEYPVRELSVF